MTLTPIGHIRTPYVDRYSAPRQPGMARQGITGDAAEGIIRRPLSIKLRERLMYVGLVLIGLLMIFAFGNDFRRLLGW